MLFCWPFNIFFEFRKGTDRDLYSKIMGKEKFTKAFPIHK